MKIPLFVQARMSSQRLPGKVLKVVRDKPVLAYVIERLLLVKNGSGIVVLTSSEKEDDPISEFCKRENIQCFRGSLINVSDRFFCAMKQFGCSGFVRVCADRPWIDPSLIDQCFEKFMGGQYDIVTNCMHPTFPKGQTVEIITKDAFAKGLKGMQNSSDREHVMPFFYRHEDEYKIYSHELENRNYSQVNLCIDTPSGLTFFSQALDRLGARYRQAGWREVAALYARIEFEST